MDRKDHLGDVLQRRALAEERLYFARMPSSGAPTHAAAPAAVLAEGHCSRCRASLRPRRIGVLDVHECRCCGALWLDRFGLRPFPLQTQDEWIAQVERYYGGRAG